MLLPPEDATLFFKLMPALQVFANQKLHIIKSLENVDRYQKVSDEQRIELRNAFYRQPELIDETIAQNVRLVQVDLSPKTVTAISNVANFHNHILIKFALNSERERLDVAEFQVRGKSVDGIGQPRCERISHGRRSVARRRYNTVSQKRTDWQIIRATQ